MGVKGRDELSTGNENAKKKIKGRGSKTGVERVWAVHMCWKSYKAK